MMDQALVAISYAVDDDLRQANLEVLSDEARVVFCRISSRPSGPRRCAGPRR
jgi:hypothetical protein